MRTEQGKLYLLVAIDRTSKFAFFTAITNYLETTRSMIGDSPDPLLGEIAEALALAAAQSLRAGMIVRRLRSFVDGRDTGFRIERLDELVEEATSLGLLGAHEASIAVTMTIAAGEDRVMVDRIQIQQVLVNLIRNAIQSMEKAPSKVLTIATAHYRDGWMRVSVADTGLGIDAEVRDRLFEAFATTKEDGMGAWAVDLPDDRGGAWRSYMGRGGRERRHRNPFQRPPRYRKQGR